MVWRFSQTLFCVLTSWLNFRCTDTNEFELLWYIHPRKMPYKFNTHKNTYILNIENIKFWARFTMKNSVRKSLVFRNTLITQYNSMFLGLNKIPSCTFKHFISYWMRGKFYINPITEYKERYSMKCTRIWHSRCHLEIKVDNVLYILRFYYQCKEFNANRHGNM